MVRRSKRSSLMLVLLVAIILGQLVGLAFAPTQVSAALGDPPKPPESGIATYAFVIEDLNRVKIVASNGNEFIRYENAFTQRAPLDPADPGYATFDGCADLISIPATGTPAGDSITLKRTIVSGVGCAQKEEINITVTNATAASEVKYGGDNFAVVGSTTEDEDNISCASQGGAMAWVACPVIDLLFGAVDMMSKLMSQLLSVPPLQANSDDATFKIWKNLRNVALALLVIVTLVAIFGQSILINMDAYTFKKMVPRLLFAGIGITLSFYISMMLIDFFNVFGRGMYSLIQQSTNGLDVEVGFGSIIAEAFIGALVAGGALLLYLNPATIATILVMLLPVILAFITALLVVLLRQALIIILVVLSPIAIVAWILPNTEGWFKRWWSMFSTALVMYPIIMLLLGAGNVFAVMITNGALTEQGGALTNNNFINYLLALVVLGGVMAAIPFTIRASGGIINKFTGALNNPNRGPIDGLRKRLQGARDVSEEKRKQDMLHATRTGKNWSGKDVGKGNGVRARARHGWYSYKTGTGWAQGGKYTDERRTELERGAMSQQQRMSLYDSQAEQQAMQLEARDFEQEYAGNVATMNPKAVGGWLRDQYAGATTYARKAAIFNTMVARKDQELEDIYKGTLTDGSPEQRQDLGRLNQANFGKIFEFAPQLATADPSKTTFDPNYKFVYEAKPEALGQIKPFSVKGAFAKAHIELGSAISRGDNDARDAASAKLSTLINSYAMVENQEKDVGLVKDMREAIGLMDPTVKASLDANALDRFDRRTSSVI